LKLHDSPTTPKLTDPVGEFLPLTPTVALRLEPGWTLVFATVKVMLVGAMPPSPPPPTPEPPPPPQPSKKLKVQRVKRIPASCGRTRRCAGKNKTRSAAAASKPLNFHQPVPGYSFGGASGKTCAVELEEEGAGTLQVIEAVTLFAPVN